MTQPAKSRPPSRSRYVTHSELEKRLHELWDYVLGQTDQITRIGEQAVATQADVDALTQAVNSDVTAINAEIAALQSANPSLDLSGLQTAVQSLNTTANNPPTAG